MVKAKWLVVAVVVCVAAAVVCVVAAAGAVTLALSRSAAPLRDAGGYAASLADLSVVVKTHQVKVVDTEGKVHVNISGGYRDLMGPSVRLQDDKGKTRAALFLGPDGGPRLALYTEKGEIRAMLSLPADGRPILGLTDGPPETGETGVVLGLLGDGGAGLAVYFGDKGKGRVAMGMHPDGRPRLMLADAKGHAIWRAP